MIKHVALVLSLAGAPLAGAAQSSNTTGMSAHPEIDNQAVTVIRIHMALNAKVPEHDVSPRVVVWLTDARLRLTFPDGSSRVEEHKAGDVAWVEALRHTGENLTDQPIEFLAVIPRSTASVERKSR